MKINRTISAFLAITLLSALTNLGLAQEDAQSSVPASDETNAPPKLKEMMAKTDEVTNTVGIVLLKISPRLWAGKYEVTQKEYQKVMGNNPSAFKGENHPVDSVSWNDAMDFCKTLTEKEQKKDELPEAYIYTLPTQAQWKQLADQAALNDAVMSLNMQHRSSTAPVGSLGPNSLGLYDTRGNVMEWCLDPQDKPYHVLRGGAWDTYVSINARVDFRWYAKPSEAKNTFGFRVVLEPQ